MCPSSYVVPSTACTLLQIVIGSVGAKIHHTFLVGHKLCTKEDGKDSIRNEGLWDIFEGSIAEANELKASTPRSRRASSDISQNAAQIVLSSHVILL